MIFWRQWNEKNGEMYDEYDSSFGKEHEMDDDISSMSDTLADNAVDKLYIWLSDITNGERYLVEGNK